MADAATLDLNLAPQSIARANLGRWVLAIGSALLATTVLVQILNSLGILPLGLTDWRPTLYAFIVWGVALGVSRVLIHGEAGEQSLFVLPALLFTIAMVIFPTIFGLAIAFTDWNLSSNNGQKFNGLDNIRQMIGDPYFWNALLNMVYYVLAVLVQYAIAFGLALLLNADAWTRPHRTVFLSGGIQRQSLHDLQGSIPARCISSGTPRNMQGLGCAVGSQSGLRAIRASNGRDSCGLNITGTERIQRCVIRVLRCKCFLFVTELLLAFFDRLFLLGLFKPFSNLPVNFRLRPFRLSLPILRLIKSKIFKRRRCYRSLFNRFRWLRLLTLSLPFSPS